jgi:hypothetical protein
MLSFDVLVIYFNLQLEFLSIATLEIVHALRAVPAVILMCAAILIANACAIAATAGITVALQTIELAGGRNAAGHR